MTYMTSCKIWRSANNLVTDSGLISSSKNLSGKGDFAFKYLVAFKTVSVHLHIRKTTVSGLSC